MAKEDGGDKDGSKDGGSFADRLRAASAKQAQGTAPTPAKDTSTNAMGIGARVGVELVSALVVALLIGWGLDRWLHTTPVFIALFVLLGGAAGVANVWRLMMPRKGSGSAGR